MTGITEDAEAALRVRLSESRVPQHMHDSIVRYVVHRIEPGHFMTAVLSNDLKEACGRADEVNRGALFEIIVFLYNSVPSGCWGSKDTVRAWLRREEDLPYESPRVRITNAVNEALEMVRKQDDKQAAYMALLRISEVVADTYR